MKTNLKEINSYTRQLDITIEWSLIEKEFQDEFNSARSRYSIPGFRKGKVPEQIVKRNLGPSIEANFAENSINIFYKKALEKLEIHPINQASIDNLNFKEGNDLSFSAQFEVHPKINLPKYQKKFKIQAVRYLSEEQDIIDALNNYREQHATIKTIDSGAERGHFIRGDFQVLHNDTVSKNGNKLENQYIRIGFGMFKDEVEKVLLGAKEGDEIPVTIQGKDKPLSYLVKVKKVEEQILPELDDDLAKTVNENFDTLVELKKHVKDELQVSLDKEHKELIRKEIINYFIDNSKVEAPKSMVSLYLHQIKEDFKQRKQSFDEKELIENYSSHAEWNIKWYLIKDLIIQEESIDVLDKEINSRIEEMINQNKGDEEGLKSYFKESQNKQNLYNEMLNDKLFDTLLNYVKIKVIEQSTNELRKKQAA